MTDGCDEIVLNRLWFLFLPRLLPSRRLVLSSGTYGSVCLSEMFDQPESAEDFLL